MSGSAEFTPGGEFIVEYDGNTVLDTSLPLMNLIPSETIFLEDHEITFPNLSQGTIYWQMVTGINYGCASWAGLIAQEWGPSAAGIYTLSDEIIGTVPPGIDYLDVFANLSRTVNPAGWHDLPMRSNIPQGQWTKLEGGSCQIEQFPGMRRLFEIVLDPSGSPDSTRNVLLRRYQSVTANGAVLRGYSFGTGNVLGYLAGTNAPSAPTYATYGALKQTKGPSGGANHRPPGSAISQDPCSTSAISYASTWVGDIIIKPGRIGD